MPTASHRQIVEALAQQALESVAMVEELIEAYEDSRAVNKVLRGDIDRTRRLIAVLRSQDNEAGKEATEAYHVAADLLEMVLVSGIRVEAQDLTHLRRTETTQKYVDTHNGERRVKNDPDVPQWEERRGTGR